jgi:small conductance mechanosensitive channel
MLRGLTVITLCCALSVQATAQPDAPADPDEALEAPGAVGVVPAASDDAIGERLLRILTATGWFERPEVEVNEGIAFLRGEAARAEYRQWAGDLARNTQDVVAVVNRMDVVQPSAWDFSPALAGLRQLGVNALRNIPYILFSLVILTFAWLLGLLVTRGLRRSLRERRMNTLLRDVFARGAGILVFIAGLYSVFHVAGLTNIALAVLGGTGLAGIALGIAFRDITENFLASIFLSAQNPFRTGDLVRVGDAMGFVQRMTTRATILMTLDGNHVQVPNATIYKSNITNFSANPNVRMEFAVTIGIDDSIAQAQELMLGELAAHPAVLTDPEPWVCAESIDNGSVSIRAWYWFQARSHNGLKLRSALLRLVKRALRDAGIALPPEGRELTFGGGMPFAIAQAAVKKPARHGAAESAEAVTHAETQPEPEAETLRRQAERSRLPEAGVNLLSE